MLYYTEDAIGDIVRIRMHLDSLSTRGGEIPLKDLTGRLESLVDFPQLGRVLRSIDASTEIRDWVVGRFLVRYLTEGSDVFVLRIWLQNENRSR